MHTRTSDRSPDRRDTKEGGAVFDGGPETQAESVDKECDHKEFHILLEILFQILLVPPV